MLMFSVRSGSAAAAAQAGIGGSVAAGSPFAILTSAGMGGYGVPIVTWTAWGATSLVSWGATIPALVLGRKSKEGEEVCEKEELDIQGDDIPGSEAQCAVNSKLL